MRKLKQTFEVKSRSGQRRKLNLYVDLINAASMDDRTATIEGLKTLETAEGDPVNYVSKGHYQLAHTGEVLKSLDPLAP